MTNVSDASDRLERAIRRTEQLGTAMLVLSLIALVLLFA
jgi:hypothetical protein